MRNSAQYDKKNSNNDKKKKIKGDTTMLIAPHMPTIQQPPIVTVWVHGTKPSKVGPKILEILEPESVLKFFYCDPGLNLASSLDQTCNHYKLVKKISDTAPKTFPFNTFYVFGWIGNISPADRIKTAKKLSAALKKCIKQHTQNGQQPFLRIIAHSHGGNVVLNMARIKNDDPGFIIDELVLLACPVQQETAPYIHDPLFKTIYSLHSHGDLIQVLDPQGWPSLKRSLKKIFSTNSGDAFKEIINHFQTQPFFSERHFKPCQNLTQASVTYDGKTLPHIEFMMPSFTGKLPRILRILKKWKAGKIILPADENDVLVNIDVKKKAT
jgi:hypothetical protein